MVNSLVNRTILTGVSFLAPKTMTLNMVWLEVSDTGTVQFLKDQPAS